MTNEHRGNLYLLTGLVLGLAFGLLIAWVISPLEYTDTDPGSLADPYQAEYRRMIALAYQSSSNLDRARQRLNLLGEADPVQVLAAEAQRMLAEDQSSREARALAILAADLNRPSGENPNPTAAVAQVTQASPTADGTEEGTSVAASSATGEPTATAAQAEAIRSPTPPPPTRTPTQTISPTPTRTHMPTFAPRATATPVPVQAAPYVLENRRQICDGTVLPGLLQIEVLDSEEQPQPGVKITVTWDEGEDTFYTGLALEKSPGYADFLMASGTSYSVRVGELSDITRELQSSDNCAWSLVFRQK